MKVGYVSTNTAMGIRPVVLAGELECRGFDSLWLPEHGHIPVQFAPTAAFGTDLPDAYRWAPGDPPLDRARSYADLAIDRVVICPPTMARHDSDTTMRRLDEFGPLITT